jgi:hypothetical protein
LQNNKFKELIREKLAIANKLIKQIFAIGKSKEKYQADFC